MNNFRMDLITRAYKKLEHETHGKVNIEEIVKEFDASKHPDVVKGYKTEKEIFREFVGNWDKVDPDGIISFEEFTDYYRDVSSSIEKDE